ncbi:glucan 1,3-beta-glucosidase [Sodiomyces alkalinus F11]|uniref:Glucan 1,3-beta-glucosidase n=1 Tax=Sodiomyces alkalinus (strain CBS 110278 / VKM F-3762 / F11) TaxID=1314773 RepID=A0A3N2Q2W3_SODAK|nr:glucan 1,3-beta-glucosidase [Sodiomyces alkalinus F11]ROT41090.1 glucan 1,3-beta-glucosidase [Sodiomyces alkalinus F11]
MFVSVFLLVAVATAGEAFWMAEIAHQGISPYNPNPKYQIFRNVKDFGAVGDGVKDDTAAINRAISFDDRCAPGVCNQSTITPATVYFPPGTYLISNSIIDYYYTQLIGDPTDRPVIKAASTFDLDKSLGLIDANPYTDEGMLAYLPVNVFFRQIRNLVLDTTAIPPEGGALGIHWPSSQATSISNCEFRLSDDPESEHVGLLIDGGSGGLLNDLTFYGGMLGANFGNQQYTARNLKFYHAQVAVSYVWNWGWTYKSLYIENCTTGIRMGYATSITILDSAFRSVGTAIETRRLTTGTRPPAAGSLVMYNVVFDEVEEILTGPEGVLIPGQDVSFAHVGFVMGHVYDPFGPTDVTGSDPVLFPSPPRALLDGGKEGRGYYERSKPQYEREPVDAFVSARRFGAKGDGRADDTDALNKLFAFSATTSLIAFVDAGTYFVSDTVFIPPGARIVGEALASNILGGGDAFADSTRPRPVVRVGYPGDKGRVEWSDMILGTRGAAPGALVLEVNLDAGAWPHEPSGMWDVHVRVGGYPGTEQMLEQCPATPGKEMATAESVPAQCVVAWGSVHITRPASGLLMENCWVWIADHDLEDQEYAQISLYAGRGVLVDSERGRLWFSASASEHHVLYQYSFRGARDVYMGHIQTESPYFQPNPPAPVPFPLVEGYGDPDFGETCRGRERRDPHDPAVEANATLTVPCAMAWGLLVRDTRAFFVYGAGLYSFFNNYDTDCSREGYGAICQQRIFGVTASSNPAVVVYNLNVVGARAMVTRDEEDIAWFDDNRAGFTSLIAVYENGGGERSVPGG